MGRGNYAPEIQLRKVINTAIFKAGSLSAEEKQHWININKNTDPRKAAGEVLKALKLNITSEDRATIFKALLNTRNEEGKKPVQFQ